MCSLITLFNILMNKKVRHLGKRKTDSSARKHPRKLHCDAPNPTPEGVSSEGVTLQDWDSLTFSFSEMTPVPVFSLICTISVITKIFYIYIIHTTIVAFIIFYTHILESLYLSNYNFTITKLYIYLSNENQRLRNSAVSTYL